MTLLKRQDHAHDLLIPHLQRTQEVLLAALRELDAAAQCQITAAPDLCIPHDAIRIGGGFATGCLVEWQCSTPIIPIDCTVNIDLTSCFVADQDLSEFVTTDNITRVRNFIEKDSSYEWNLHKGNHFISAARNSSNGKFGIIIHSNEKEFKYQYNGLMPVPDNWYWNDVRIFRRGDRFIRLLIGEKALLFAKIAKMLENYSVIRHAFFASIITGRSAWEEERHDFHYYMPSSQSVAIGCYVAAAGDVVPILSRPGRPIDYFRLASGGQNAIDLLDGGSALIAPHGWGKTAKEPLDFHATETELTLNGIGYPMTPKTSLGRHPALTLRDYADNIASSQSLYSEMANFCPGSVLERWEQAAWYCQDLVSVAA